MENTSDSFMPRPLLFCLKSGRSVCYSVPDNSIASSALVFMCFSSIVISTDALAYIILEHEKENTMAFSI